MEERSFLIAILWFSNLKYQMKMVGEHSLHQGLLNVAEFGVKQAPPNAVSELHAEMSQNQVDPRAPEAMTS